MRVQCHLCKYNFSSNFESYQLYGQCPSCGADVKKYNHRKNQVAVFCIVFALVWIILIFTGQV